MRHGYTNCNLSARTCNAVGVLHSADAEGDVKNPSQPDTQPDEYIAEAPNAHKQRAGVPNADVEGVNPRRTSSMPRGEDDPETWSNSPEYNDRTDVPEGGTVRIPPDSVGRVEPDDPDR
jgi:hypothetical protein